MPRGGDVNVEFGGDASKYEDALAGIDKSSKRLEKSIEKNFASASSAAGGFGTALAGLGRVISLGAISAGIKKLADEASRVVHIAQRFDQSAAGLLKLKNIGEQSGLGLEKLAMSLTKANEAAQRGDKAFDGLGISAADFLKAQPGEKVLMLAEAFQRAEKAGTGLAELKTILADGYSDMLPTFRRALDELRQAIADAVVPDDRTLENIEKSATEVGDAYARAKSVIMSAMGSAFAYVETRGTSLANNALKNGGWAERIVRGLGMGGALDKAAAAPRQAAKQQLEAMMAGRTAGDYVATTAREEAPITGARTAAEGTGDLAGPGGAALEPEGTSPEMQKRMREKARQDEIAEELRAEEAQTAETHRQLDLEIQIAGLRGDAEDVARRETELRLAAARQELELAKGTAREKEAQLKVAQLEQQQAGQAPAAGASYNEQFEAAVEQNLMGGMSIGKAKKAARKSVRAQRAAARAVERHRRESADAPSLMDQYGPGGTPELGSTGAENDRRGSLVDEYGPASPGGIYEQVGGRTPQAPAAVASPAPGGPGTSAGSGATLDDLKQLFERANEYLETMSGG